MRNTLFAFTVSISALSAFAQDDLTLWYDKPAQHWVEALPLGNGRLGAMLYGGVSSDTLQLNEDTFWSGSPYNNYNPKALSALPDIRKALDDEDWVRAQQLSMANITADKSLTAHGMAYASVGRMVLSFPSVMSGSHYVRSLDLHSAVAKVAFDADGTHYEREAFTSLADNVTVVHLTATGDSPLEFSLHFVGPQNAKRAVVSSCVLDNSTLRVFTKPGTPDFENVPNGLHCTTFARVLADGLVSSTSDGRIGVRGAKSATILISSATNFVDYKDITADSDARAIQLLDAVADSHLSYDMLRERHVAKYREQFDRVSLSLGSNPAMSAMPTDQRIARFRETDDCALAAMYFQFGRYLLISSSQPGTQPANLQGIWNPDAAPYPAWDSKYTTNINVEMNYWPAEVTNLSECHQPMLQMIREVSQTGRQSASLMYGARGWTLHHNTDIFRSTGAVDYASCSIWPTANAWFCSHIWEHYLYTADLAFLRDAYPILREASLFYVDFLSRDPHSGYLVVSPSTSPENNPGKGSYVAPSGKKMNCAVFSGVTMDNQMVYDLLRSTILASEHLGVDASFADSLRVIQSQLPPMHIGQYGQLQEWLQDWDREFSSHRHVSHLWGLFPGNMISPFAHPELFQAARKSLVGRGDNSRGWSMGWKVCLWARLLDGNHAYTLIKNQLNLKSSTATIKDPDGGTYANMFDAHPPFQIDGNFGCCAGIAEMLVQSHDECLHLLPALPDVWKATGEVRGLCVRGGFLIKELQWRDGRVVRLVVESRNGGNLRIRSANSLKGKGLKPAKGPNPNPLFLSYSIPDPVIADKSKIPALSLSHTNLYDVNTIAGETYTFVSR